MKTIDDIFIDDTVIETINNKKFAEKVTNKTSNSVEVSRTARGVDGIDCKQWYTWADFIKKFEHPTVVMQ